MIDHTSSQTAWRLKQATTTTILETLIIRMWQVTLCDHDQKRTASSNESRGTSVHEATQKRISIGSRARPTSLVVTCHGVSCHVISNHVSYRVISCHVVVCVSCRVVSCRRASRHFVSYHVAFCHVLSCPCGGPQRRVRKLLCQRTMAVTLSEL